MSRRLPESPTSPYELADFPISTRLERWHQLSDRDLHVRAIATLKSRGDYDPGRYGDADKYLPLTAGEHVELLVLGESIARSLRDLVHVDRALEAGVTWQEVATATGQDERDARRDYQVWVDDRHDLHQSHPGATSGMTDEQHAQATARAAAR
ncbi:hypothetical protein [Sphaerisporangium corydalis]|uniref:Uncharacterized protein n=1 Tax=Sphaerisporangium corydalis TaxID=1441875 RepID=A0ABV9ERK7_9ACTN|nr:hypothetical protein [Sphaerisporangium corydalis]